MTSIKSPEQIVREHLIEAVTKYYRDAGRETPHEDAVDAVGSLSTEDVLVEVGLQIVEDDEAMQDAVEWVVEQQTG